MIIYFLINSHITKTLKKYSNCRLGTTRPFCVKIASALCTEYVEQNETKSYTEKQRSYFATKPIFILIRKTASSWRRVRKPTDRNVKLKSHIPNDVQLCLSHWLFSNRRRCRRSLAFCCCCYCPRTVIQMLSIQRGQRKIQRERGEHYYLCSLCFFRCGSLVWYTVSFLITKKKL